MIMFLAEQRISEPLINLILVFSIQKDLGYSEKLSVSYGLQFFKIL